MVMIKNEKADTKIKKPFLGGWRNKLNGNEYLNAVSQTGPPLKKIPWCCVFSKEVQCIETKEKSVQSIRHRATQMWRYVEFVSMIPNLIYIFYL